MWTSSKTASLVVQADEAEGKSQERSWGDMAKQLSSILGSSIGRYEATPRSVH
jgi:hypothetical protein